MAAATVNWFTSEIQQMMYGFGDVRRPLHETAILVEEIVHQQMTQVLYQAMEVAQMRGRNTIGAEDVVFLLRKNPVKLARLVRYMDAKDKKAAVIRGTCLEDEDGSADLAEKPQTPKKRKKAIVDFLATIDQTGELLAALDESRVDEVKHERLLRAEMQARGMDPQQYIEFCRARQTNFSRRYKSQRFKDWLMSNVHIDMKPNLPALEIISYLAYETIAQVVDLALIVKQTRLKPREDVPEKQMPSTVFNYQDAWLLTSLAARSSPHPSTAQAGTPTQEAAAAVPGGSTTPGTTTTATATATATSTTTASSASTTTSTSSATASAAKPSKGKKRKKSGSTSSPDALLLQAILPSDVQEAMRRFHTNIGPLTSIVSASHAYPVKKRLLCA